MRSIAEFLKKPYLAILATLIVSVLCFMPSSAIPDAGFKYQDKLHHILAFAGLAFLWQGYIQHYLKVFFSLVLFGYFIEVVQKNLPADFRRGFDYFDVLADTTGILVGFGFFLIYGLIIRRFNF